MVSNQPVADSVNDAETFNRDGILIAKGLYSTKEMLDWKARIIGILEAGGHIGKDPKAAGVHVFMADLLDPFFSKRMQDACVVSVLNRIIGPNVEFLSVKSVYKNKYTHVRIALGTRTGTTGKARPRFPCGSRWTTPRPRTAA